MIIMFFATQTERSKPFNTFTLIVYLIFLNPYQIGIGSTISNYILANIALLSLWFVLLIYSGRQIITSKLIFAIITVVTNKISDLKVSLIKKQDRTHT